MAGVRGQARNAFKVEIRSDVRRLQAHARAMEELVPAALTTSLVNVVLAGIEQAEKNGIVRGSENPSGKPGTWFSKPVPGADHHPGLPTKQDIEDGHVTWEYIRNEKGHIIDRKPIMNSTPGNYLFRDKVVSRTGDLFDDFSFDGEPDIEQGRLDPSILRDRYHFESNLGGMTLSAIGGEALLRTTPTRQGQKIATLEKRRADNGRMQPRYWIRRNLQSVTRRWSTAFKAEMRKAEKEAKKAADRAARKASR